jgi:hypothetical protein
MKFNFKKNWYYLIPVGLGAYLIYRQFSKKNDPKGDAPAPLPTPPPAPPAVPPNVDAVPPPPAIEPDTPNPVAVSMSLSEPQLVTEDVPAPPAPPVVPAALAPPPEPP